MSAIVGIDLGTTNSCVAVLEGTEATVIHNELGGRTTPSVVAFKEDGGILVGAAAKRQAVTNPRDTLFAVKRLIGRKFDSPATAELRRTMPYEIIRANNGDAWVRVGDRDMSPPEVSAHVLGHLKRIAEEYLGKEVTQAIVTVPAYFDDAQRQATKDAGRIAGLEIRAILNEPTAAALAYGVHRTPTGSVIAVFDLGGGTFDISILRIEDGVFSVMATSGDSFLGGDDFDRMVIDALVHEFQEEHGVDLGEDPVALQRLKEASERAKQELSSSLDTEVHLPFVAVGPQGPLHLVRKLTRDWLEQLTRPLLERLEGPCRRAIGDAKLNAAEIDQVVLVGGMTRMPAVVEKTFNIFGKRPVKGVNPDEIVAIGAATQSAIMRGGLKEVVLLDVTSHSLGIRVEGNRFSALIHRNTHIPVRETKIFATTENDQEFVSVEVFQGDTPLVSGSRLLGQFLLGDLPRGPAGSVQVQVSFTLDVDGILCVDAKEIRTGKVTSKRILASSGLSRDTVEELSRAYAGR
ncbi:MAG: molecular chaperone DnaK [Myxococcales bacterium]|nr:molecular chaperone DnaK [Myxococcales bacterium]